MRSMLTLLLFVALATPVFASDGLLEINQTCAEQTGCFAGDTAGFPVTIRTPGTSYRLTSLLTVPNEDTDGIAVSTNDVGIDLNNFGILGPVTCSGSPVICAPIAGTGSGVETTSQTNRGISVRNGSITGMGRYGVSLGEQAEVTNLRVRWNRLSGISVSGSSIISDNMTYQNGASGIETASGTIVTGNTANQNGGDGIVALFGCSVQRNIARGNVLFGLNLAGVDTTYRENTILLNGSGPVSGAAAVNKGDNYCSGPSTLSAACP